TGVSRGRPHFLSFQIAKAYDVVIVADRQRASVVRKRQATNRPALRDGAQLFLRVHGPETHRLAAGDELAAVAREAQASERLLFEREDFSRLGRGVHIPDSDDLIPAMRGKELAAGREHESADLALKTGDGFALFPSRRLPKLDQSAFFGGSKGGERL